MIVDFLFGDIVKCLDSLLYGCESAFVSNFIVSFAYRKIHAGMMVQKSDWEFSELFIVWHGAVAVCETTEFHEPVLIYERGSVFNLYQLLMDVELPFDYRAVWPDEYSKKNHSSNVVNFNRMHQIRKDKIAFNEHKFKPNEFPLTQKDV